jgi:hypothetical protein
MRKNLWPLSTAAIRGTGVRSRSGPAGMSHRLPSALPGSSQTIDLTALPGIPLFQSEPWEQVKPLRPRAARETGGRNSRTAMQTTVGSPGVWNWLSRRRESLRRTASLGSFVGKVVSRMVWVRSPCGQVANSLEKHSFFRVFLFVTLAADLAKWQRTLETGSLRRDVQTTRPERPRRALPPVAGALGWLGNDVRRSLVHPLGSGSECGR